MSADKIDAGLSANAAAEATEVAAPTSAPAVDIEQQPSEKPAAEEAKGGEDGSKEEENDDGEAEDGDVDGDEIEVDATPETLLELLTSASLAYAKQAFPLAADMYSTAAAVQDGIYGEMVPTNAEVLFLYGQSLFKTAVENSDVLGGKGAEEALKGSIPGAGRVGDLIEPIKQNDKGKETAKGQFHFAEDEMEGEDDEDDDEDDEDEEGGEGNGDEFADAYEILEVARVLFEKVKEHVETSPDAPLPENVAFKAALEHAAKSYAADNKEGSKGKETGDSTTGEGAAAVDNSVILRHAKSRLAAIHDYQAEIYLESEQFHDAIREFEVVVGLREELEPEHSGLVAEGRYKLALAMEFASLDAIRKAQQEKQQQTFSKNVNGAAGGAATEGAGEGDAGANGTDAPTTAAADDAADAPKVDEALRARAADMMQRAVDSCKLRVTLETAKLEKAKAGSSDDADRLEREIEDLNEMIADMEQRVQDLKNPVDLAALNGAAEGAEGDGALPGGLNLQDVLGAAISGAFGVGAGSSGLGGKSAVAAEARDISGLVKTKRKRDGEDGEGEGEAGDGECKKAKNGVSETD